MKSRLLSLTVLLWISTIAHSQCICDIGQFRSGPSTCKPCPPGTFQDKQGRSTRCKPCPKNFASIKPGASQCTPCGNKSIPEQNKPTACVCKKGFKVRISSPGIPFCQVNTCPAGRFAGETADGGFRCITCPPGTFKSKAGASKCKSCPSGSYSDFGATKCFTCGKDEAVLDSGECGKCSPGATRGSGLFCEECPEGTFKPGKGNGPCRKCPPKSASIRGSARCLSCPKNTVPLRKDPADECGACPGGSKYEPVNWLCFPCPQGFFLPKGQFLKKCRKCPRGSYSKGGSRACTACPDGTVLMKDKSCKGCPPGTKYVDFLFECEKCEPNTFGDGGSSQNCTPCAKGSYAGEGASKCVKCPSGTALISSTGKCDKCPPGSFYIQRQANCAPCFEGIMPKASIALKCMSCRSGTEPNKDRTACVETQTICKVDKK